jgi:hypothetical protein
MLISKQYIKMAEATQKASITKDKESEITTYNKTYVFAWLKI